MLFCLQNYALYFILQIFSLYFYKKVAITRLFRAMATLFQVILGLYLTSSFEAAPAAFTIYIPEGRTTDEDGATSPTMRPERS